MPTPIANMPDQPVEDVDWLMINFLVRKPDGELTMMSNLISLPLCPENCPCGRPRELGKLDTDDPTYMDPVMANASEELEESMPGHTTIFGTAMLVTEHFVLSLRTPRITN